MKNHLLLVLLACTIFLGACTDSSIKKEQSEAYVLGTAFLEANAQKANIMTTETGLQYTVLKEGDGNTPVAKDTVKVHYRGTLINGDEFDSSYSRGEASSFPVNRVIPGWTEGLQLMKEGAKYRFYIPEDLAYGNRRTGKIVPYSALIFDVELISIEVQSTVSN
ncbi:FKBP-type peptidyl-prolyl cis-trans isomerase [Glaciecola sp. SC05]|uniref:FKBP-type peptidyl-prolyl cis-trans isomerase n=1 Tax=Glaciecola sp. SC05 TaxID=1987355 RepID=UPI0035277D39